MRVRRYLTTSMAASLGLLAVACTDEAAPRAQWLVHIGTDAPLPQLGDRLLVELVDSRGELACTGCRRQFSVATPDSWPVSFGVPAELSGPTMVVARLFRSLYTGANGLPAGAALIEGRGWLPDAASGLEDLGLVLSMRCFGREGADDLAVACDPSSGDVGPTGVLERMHPAELPGVGSWPGAASVPCGAPAPEGMVCIEGGAYLLGDYRLIFGSATASAARQERLVIVSPFYLDEREVSVDDVSGVVSQMNQKPLPATGDPAVGCSFAPDDPDAAALPINCVSHAFAEEYCALRGKRLPAEAEWEYVATGRQAEATFPWGEDGTTEAICDRAIVGRGVSDTTDDLTCRSLGGVVPSGLVAEGGSGDVSAEGVRDLAGSVAEWTADDFQPLDGPCWKGGPVALDATACDGDAAEKSLRGGTWRSPPYFARASVRLASPPAAESPEVGFRCAAP